MARRVSYGVVKLQHPQGKLPMHLRSKNQIHYCNIELVIDEKVDFLINARDGHAQCPHSLTSIYTLAPMSLHGRLKTHLLKRSHCTPTFWINHHPRDDPMIGSIL